jgi:hypothetical protein
VELTTVKAVIVAAEYTTQQYKTRVWRQLMARWLVAIGLVLVMIGLLWPLFSKLGLGRLPGDIVIERGNFHFYFPIVTCLVLSVVLSFVLWLLNR